MEKEIKLNKYLFKTLMKTKCIHFIRAFEKKLLDISDDDAFSNEEVGSLEYSDLSGVFGNKDISEISDAVKFSMKLKNKVMNYYIELHKEDLKDHNKNFQETIEGTFLTFDLFKKDDEQKEIEFIVIKPSTWKDHRDYFLKTWDRHKKKNEWFIDYLPDNIYEKYKTFYESGWSPSCFNSLNSTKILLVPETWKENKKSKAYELLFMMEKLFLEYPGYKITAKLPLLEKKLKPYSFKELVYTIYPNDEKHLEAYKAIFKRNDILVQQYLSTEGKKKFTLPDYQSKFPTNKNCFICNVEKSEKKISQHYNETLVEKLLVDYPNKIAMFDFETINDPLPDTDFYYPYDKIVVQVSIHLLEKGEIVNHQEYITKDLSKKELSIIYDMLVNVIASGYRLCAYSKSFEGSAIATMERVLEREDISQYYILNKDQRILSENTEKMEILDLLDFFTKLSNAYPISLKCPISLERFGPFYSIKKTIEFYAGDQNPYSKLSVNNGFKAMQELYDLIVERKFKNSEEILPQLYRYCKQDTLTMVNIYNKICDVRKSIQANPADKEKILNQLDIK